MEVTVVEVIRQMGYVIPSIITATCTLTAAIKGIFKIEKEWVNHLISWVLAMLCAIGFVALNGLSFGLGGWDYAIGALCGVLVGASANGVYDWNTVQVLFDAITSIFGGREIIERKRARKLEDTGY